MTTLDVGRNYPAQRRQSRRPRLGPARACRQADHADGALCPRAADHHRADGHPAIGRRLRVHGAALESGDAEIVRRRGRRHRGPDRGLSRLSAGRRPPADPADRAGEARPRGRFPARDRHAAAGPEAVLLAARPGAVGGIAQADRAAVLDRHRRKVGLGRNPHPARQQRDARFSRRAAPPMRPIRKSSCSGWSAPRWCCSPSRSSSCATRSGRSCGSPTPRKPSARGATCRITGRAARARCGARRSPSSK